MGYFALVKNNKVLSVIVANREFIDATSATDLAADLTVEVFANRPEPGYVYDPDTGTFTPPTE